MASSTGGYYGLVNGSYVPLSADQPDPAGGFIDINTPGAQGDPFGNTGGHSVTFADPNNTDYYGTSDSTVDPSDQFDSNGQAYTGNVYSQGSDGTYALFTTGDATANTAPATSTATPSTTPATSTNTNDGTTAANSVTGTTTTAPGVSNAGQVQGTDLLASQMQEITNQNINALNNPQVPASATATPVNQQVQSGELLNTDTEDANTGQISTSEGNIPASTVGSVATASNPAAGLTAAQYNATLVDPSVVANTTQAVTAALPSDALVSTQLQQLLTPDANGNLPSWIQPAITAADQLTNGLGIANSTMAAQAITTAILTAAMPVAQANASAELTAFQQNLTNEQQAAMQNGQNVVNTLLSNQSAINAASNFNATSQNQTAQYVASLAAQINQFNASQVNSVAQFNATQTQTAATNSAQLQAQLDEFNANMSNQVSQFNIQNAITVAQSNAEYLRAVNTANTAVANQDNQLNATNAMNLSDQAMANLQQQFNDDATMLYNSNMTSEEQNYSLQYLATQYALQDNLDSDLSSMEQGAELSTALGTAASNIIGTSLAAGVSGVGTALGNLLGSNSSSSGTSGTTDLGNSSIDSTTGNNSQEQQNEDNSFVNDGSSSDNSDVSFQAGTDDGD